MTAGAGVAEPLELLAEEDLSIDRVGAALCDELLLVRDELLERVVETARRLEAHPPALTAARPVDLDAGVLDGLVQALALVLDVDLVEARRQALRKVAADRVRRAA